VISEQHFETFQARWNELNSLTHTIGVAGRRVDEALDDISQVPANKIERYGDVVVYPSPAFPGWFDVKSADNVIVSFCGELAHRNAVVFARRWGRRNE